MNLINNQLSIIISLQIVTVGSAFTLTALTPVHHCRSNKVLTSSLSSSITSTIKEDDFDIEIISHDPKCFLIKNLLSPEECEEYISRANCEIEASRHNADKDGDERKNNDNSMRRSNAPDVSIKISRLWPLPFLCLGAGIPPVVKLFLNTDDISSSTSSININNVITLKQIISVALPNISLALIITGLSIVAITQGMRQYAEKFTRTSKSIALNNENDMDFIRSLVTRASSITDHDWSQWEAPVITKYDPGALFASHNDASPTKGSEWGDLGGQRVVTVITYLNTCEKGGGTKFDSLNFTVQPKQGCALVFYPANSNTLEADERTVHQSLPAVEDKYIVQLFGRHKRVPPPLGIPDTFFMK